MCGLAGIWDFSRSQSSSDLGLVASQMADQLNHRGPDDQGVIIPDGCSIALAHRRLSIIDLTITGRQPMVSSSGNLSIIYNGEIYNTLELRHNLEKVGCSFRGQSDTEILLEGMAEYGVREFLCLVNGMFSFALFDKRSNRLWMARDRLGIKPLYYGIFDNCLIFGSELKALAAYRKMPRTIDTDAVAAFLTNGYIPTPLTIYQGVAKLPAGSIIEFDQSGKKTIYRYWNLEDSVVSGLDDPIDNVEEAKHCLSELLLDSVKRQMISDVPLGGLLSSGLDSSLVIAMMQQVSHKSIETFTIGFEKRNFDESLDARKVSEFLGTKHHDHIVTADEAKQFVPKLASIYDEPFADSSQIPFCILSDLVSQHVTVTLSGDGGDELFGGYRRYIEFQRLEQILARLPQAARIALGAAMVNSPDWAWNYLSAMIPATKRPMALKERGRALGKILSSGSLHFYNTLQSAWSNSESLLIQDYKLHGTELSESNLSDIFPDKVAIWQYIDSMKYLPDDILTKVDRASMNASVEVRVPFLDHRLVELSWRLPTSMKIRRGVGKWIVREVARDYLKPEFINFPKKGFGIPIDEWLRSTLRQWAEDLINPTIIRKHELLDANLVWQYWLEHQSGRRNLGYWLWNVVCLHAWMESHHSVQPS